MIGNPKIHDCRILQLDKIQNRAGSITVIEKNKSIPFIAQRVFYLYDMPAGESRGSHSHFKCHQFIVAASGSFEVLIDDGVDRKVITLNRPFYGIHIPPGIWANEQNFSSGAICLVLASHKYNEKDYIRNYNEFLKSKGIIK